MLHGGKHTGYISNCLDLHPEVLLTIKQKVSLTRIVNQSKIVCLNTKLTVIWKGGHSNQDTQRQYQDKKNLFSKFSSITHKCDISEELGTSTYGQTNQKLKYSNSVYLSSNISAISECVSGTERIFKIH